MPKKKSKSKKATARTADEGDEMADLPQPQRVPKNQVGQVIQDFIDFGNATAVAAQEESEDVWLVSATA